MSAISGLSIIALICAYRNVLEALKGFSRWLKRLSGDSQRLQVQGE